MIGTLAAFACLAASPQKASPAAQLVSKMLKYYSDAQSLSGTITYTATDGAGQVQVVTTLQYEKPAKLYIKQVKSGQQPMQWMVTSDGKFFSYDAPQHLQNALTGAQPRLIERVHQMLVDGDGKQKSLDYDFRQIYAIAAATSIGDRSVPLDIVIGRPEDLRHDTLMWMTVEAGGKSVVGGVEGTVVTGKWKPYGDMDVDPNYPPGHYEMVISDEGKLLGYSVTQLIGQAGSAKQLRETWIVDVSLNGKTNPALFKIIS